MKLLFKKLAAALLTAAVCFAGTPAVSAGADAPAQDDTAQENDEHSGAAAIANEKVHGAGYSSTLYNSANGLPTSEANAVIQAKNGFVWIGSYSGLIRYDGNEFYRYDSSSGVASIVSLYEDQTERLWIGTNDSGIASFVNGQFRIYDQVEGLRSSSIRAITEDSAGNIIIGTTLGAAYVDTSDTLHILDAPQLNTQTIDALERDSSGVVYGVTNHGAFFTVEDLTVTSYFSGESLGLGTVNSICPDPEHKGWVYLGTSASEVIHINMAAGAKEQKLTDVSPLSAINCLQYINGEIWVCADNGIGFIHPDGSFDKLENIPMNNSIDDMMYDYEGNLWFTSSRQGVLKISECVFVDVSLAAGLPTMVVNTTCLHDGILYIGTDSGLYAVSENGYSPAENALTELLAGVRVRSVKNDSAGNMWLSTYSDHGLVCLDRNGSIIEYNADKGLDSKKVRVSEELSGGRIAASTNNGIYIIRNGRIEEHLTSADGLSESDTLTICEGDDGVIYFGSDGDGLYSYSVSGVTRRSKADGLRSEVILRIKKDPSSGVYWIITSNSIAYMRDGVITTVSNFPYSNNFDMFFDGDGGVWILSSNGIYVTTASELIENPEDIEYIFYDTSCGLPSVATANSRSQLSDNGDLYISGGTGVSLININTARADNSEIKLLIPYVELDDRTITLKPGETLTIPSDSKRLTIYSYALTFSLKNPSLSYGLQGFDKELYTSLKQDMEPVSYTNLEGGTYRFVLSAVDTLTGQVKNTVSLVINKELAFYEQVWFRIVVILAAGFVLFLLFEVNHRRRERALLREQERKQTLIDEMIQAFAKCVDMKDKYTNGHSFRVAEYSKLLAEKMGKSEGDIRDVYNVALLHDIGKISIPDSVLNKPGKPTDEEYEILKTHAANGYEVLKDITIAPELAYGAGYHHERLDGKGYPNGLKGDEIPEVAQIIAVADTFDAMYSTRPYRKQMDVNVVLDELKRVSGTQLNGEVVNYLVELVEEGKIGQREL